MKKKLLSIILMLAIIFTMMPISTFAYDNKLVIPRTLLKDVYVEGLVREYRLEYGPSAVAAPFEFFTDADGNFCLFSRKNDYLPMVYTFDEDFKVKSKVVISLPKYDEFGTFTMGNDGKYYFAVGYNNKEENGNKTVVKVHQVSPTTGKVLKTANLKGNQFGSKFRTIQIPFQFGTADMVHKDGKLYLLMAHTLFKGSDGKNHQCSNMYIVDLKTMKFSKGSLDFYVSHSFNQILKKDGNSLVSISHGDAAPRAMRLAVQDSKGNIDKTDFLQMSGKYGENATGATVNGLEIGDKNYLVVGNSVTNGNPVKGQHSWGNERDTGRNIYLSVINKSNLFPKHIWLTEFDPKGKDVTVGEPKIVKVAKNKFAVLYSITTKQGSYMEYKLVDENGKTLKKSKFDKSYFQSPVTPLLKDGKLIWISPWVAAPESTYVANTEIKQYGFSPVGWTYLFELNVQSPMNPRLVQGVRPTSIVIEQSNIALAPGDGTKLTAKVLPASSPFDLVTWLSGNTAELHATSYGYISAITQKRKPNVIAQSVLDKTVYTSVPVTISEFPPVNWIINPKSIKNKPKGNEVAATYNYIDLALGSTNWDLYLKSGNSERFPSKMTSSNPNVVEIDNGRLVGRSIGKATITLVSEDNKTFTCEVSVYKKAKPGLTITKWPRTEFTQGAPFDSSGLELTYTSKEGATARLTDKNVYLIISNEYNTNVQNTWGRGRPLPNKLGTTKVRILYANQVVSYNINITKWVDPSANTDNNEVKEQSDPIKSATYMIASNKDTNQVLDVSGGSKNDNAGIIIYSIGGDDNQKFTLKKVGSKYSIKAIHSGKALTVPKSGTGVQVVQSKYTGAKNQLFTLKEHDGKVNIQTSEGLYLGISAGSTKNGTPLITWTKSSEGSQDFIFRLM